MGDCYAFGRRQASKEATIPDRFMAGFGADDFDRHAGLVPAPDVQQRMDSVAEVWTPERVGGDGRFGTPD
jgi:hypothetical protein